MDLFQKLIDLVLHLDTHVSVLIQQCGSWTYFIIFGVIFAETGFVVTPLLPGDSLLFVLGTFAARGAFSPFILAALLILAAVLGDSANYAIGKYLGNRLVHAKRAILKKEHLDRTHRFYQKYGGKTIILARFVPIVRTFAPFVAGIGCMNYLKFFIYNVTGGILWVSIFLFGGFYFGNITVVKEHFSLVTLLIVGISIMPAIIEFFRARTKK
ncbi:MAG TPA: DedA family protein [Candidatus Margulisiibacteriota bacterium]|nr:DedA family protein [Candidatus Margulisiibacteriota bacterium]